MLVLGAFLVGQNSSIKALKRLLV